MKTIYLLILLLSAGHIVTAQPQQPDSTDDGIRLYREGKYADAIEQLSRIVAANKKEYIAWTYLGAAYLYTGKRKEAVKALETAARGPKYFLTAPDSRVGDSLVILHNTPVPRLTQQSLQGPVFGSIIMAIEFRHDGTIGFVVPVNSLTGDQTDAVVDAARQFKFSPAKKSGKMVTAVVIYDFSWR